MTKQEYAVFKNAKTDKLIKELVKMGYSQKKSGGGSHLVFESAGKPSLSIPLHRELSAGTWRNIGRLLNLE